MYEDQRNQTGNVIDEKLAKQQSEITEKMKKLDLSTEEKRTQLEELFK